MDIWKINFYLEWLYSLQFNSFLYLFKLIHMGGFIRFLGRLLFVSLLLTSAVVKFREPNTQVAALTTSYNTLRDLYPSVTNNLPPTTTVIIKWNIDFNTNSSCYYRQNIGSHRSTCSSIDRVWGSTWRCPSLWQIFNYWFSKLWPSYHNCHFKAKSKWINCFAPTGTYLKT